MALVQEVQTRRVEVVHRHHDLADKQIRTVPTS